MEVQAGRSLKPMGDSIPIRAKWNRGQPATVTSLTGYIRLVRQFQSNWKALEGWCREQDLNLHAFRHTVLSRARLPIPPSRPLDILNQQRSSKAICKIVSVKAWIDLRGRYRRTFMCKTFVNNPVFHRELCYKRSIFLRILGFVVWPERLKKAGRISAGLHRQKRILRSCLIWSRRSIRFF
jgi:hypothetical protein